MLAKTFFIGFSMLGIICIAYILVKEVVTDSTQGLAVRLVTLIGVVLMCLCVVALAVIMVGGY